MKSFRLKKTSAHEDVTHETLIWLAVLLFIVAPILVFFAGPYLRDFMGLLAFG